MQFEWSVRGTVPLFFEERKCPMERSIEFLHPIMRPVASKLVALVHEAHADGHIKTWFMPFETVRTPMRQKVLYQKGRQLPGKIVTNAKPWESAHQFGLALDLVPYMPLSPGSSSPGYRWTWEAPAADWEFMRKTARSLGMKTPLEWDLPHIEDEMWLDFKTVIRYVEKRELPPM